MYKEDLALNNLQGLICHKTHSNQIIHIYTYICLYKEDLALNNLYPIKPNQTKLYIYIYIYVCVCVYIKRI